MQAKHETAQEETRTVAKALDVLLCFSHSEPELSLTEISARLGIHKSTMHRLLGTLEAKRFVQRDPETGRYRLGTRILELAFLVMEHNDLQQRARPHLYRLVEQCQETVDLSVLDGTHVVYLEVVESPHRVKLAARPGQRLPVHSTASGKAFLAFVPPHELDRLLPEELTRYTESTLATREALLKDLEATRERGFAVSSQEYEAGINAVAAPVLDMRGYPIAAVAVAGPAFRLTPERILEIAPAVRATAEAIARDVGAISL
ncbi:MAG: IclR family transcriptional regulator [Anaerolineales bacterium]